MVKNELALMSNKNGYFRNCDVPYYIHIYNTGPLELQHILLFRFFL